MTYSLLDDSDWEEWERRRQESDQLGGLLGGGPDIGPLPSVPAPSFESPQMAPLNLDDIGSDWTTGIAAGAAGLGAIADLALNKGRNTGAILSAGAAGANQAAGMRLNELERATQYEQQRARQAAEAQYQAQRRQLELGNLDARNAEIALARERFTETLPMQQQRLAQGDARISQADARLGQGERRLDMAGDLGLVEDKAGATARGRITAENALAEQTGKAKAAEFEQLTPAHVDRAEQTAQATMDERAALAGATTQARENVTGARAAREEKGNQDRLNKFREETQSSRPLAATAAELDKVMAKYPGDAPGTGVWDSWKSGKLSSDDDLRVRAAIADMNDLVKRMRSGMAVTTQEGEQIAKFTTAGDGATEQQFRIAFEALKRYARNELKQQSVGREGEARSVLGQYGDWALGPLPPDSNTGPVAGAVYPAGPGGVQDRLPVTNQKRSQVPLVSDAIRLGPSGPGAPGAVNMPAAAPGGGGGIMMTDLEGETGMVPAHMVQQALQAGYTRAQ